MLKPFPSPSPWPARGWECPSCTDVVRWQRAPHLIDLPLLIGDQARQCTDVVRRQRASHLIDLPLVVGDQARQAVLDIARGSLAPDLAHLRPSARGSVLLLVDERGHRECRRALATVAAVSVTRTQLWVRV